MSCVENMVKLAICEMYPVYRSITIQALAQCGSAACFSGLSSWARSGKAGQPIAAMLSMLLAAGNMGNILQAAGTQGPAAILACAANVRLPLTTRQAAVQSLRRMQLTDEMRQVLLDSYSDWKTPVELRLTSYLALMRSPSKENLKKILLPLSQEPNGQIKSFVASHVANILDSNEVLKQKIEEVLGGQAVPSAMDSRKFSRNYKLFKTMNIPGLKLPLWGQIESNVIFDPSSYLPRSVMLETTLNLLGNHVDLFEIGLDGKGFEAPLEALFGPEGFFPTMKASLMTEGKLPKEANDVLKRWLGMQINGNQKPSDLPMELMKNLQKLVADVNMHREDMDAAAYLRIFGTEFGYLKLNDIQGLPTAFSAIGKQLVALFPKVRRRNKFGNILKGLGHLIDKMLEQRIAQTDMTIRHIMSKSLEVCCFINGSMSYKFNKDSWFLTIPLPMGGRTTSAICLLPMTLHTPALNYPSLSMRIPSHKLTLPPGVRIPNSHTLRLPLFGALSMKYNLKNNLYNWTFDAEFGNKTTGDEKVPKRCINVVISSSHCVCLSFFSGNIKVSHTGWKVLELQTGLSHRCPLIDFNSTFESATDLSGGFSSRLQGLAGVEIPYAKANTSFKATVEARDGQASFLHNVETKSTLLNKFHNNFNHTISGFYHMEDYNSKVKTTMVIDSSFGNFVDEWQVLFTNRQLTISDINAGNVLSFLLNNTLSMTLSAEEIKGSMNSKVRRGLDVVIYKAQIVSDEDALLLNEELKGSLFGMFFNYSAGFRSDDEQINLYSVTEGRNRETSISKLAFNNKINITYTLSGIDFSFVERGGYNKHELHNTLLGSFNSKGLLILMETFLNNASHKARLKINSRHLQGRSKTMINYPGLSFENNIEGNASLSGVFFTAFMNGTMGKQNVMNKFEVKTDASELIARNMYKSNIFYPAVINHGLDVMLRSDGIILKTMLTGKFANNELSNINELRVKLWTLKLESISMGDVYGSQISNNVNVNIGFPRQTFYARSNWKFKDIEMINIAKLDLSSLKLNFDNNFTSKCSSHELKQKFEVLYSDMAGHFRVSTNGSFYGGNIKNKLNMEFAGLSGKLESSTKYFSEPLEFSNMIQSSVRPFAVNLEMTTDGKMMVRFFGEHSGEMYSNIMLQSKPLVYTLKHAYTGSSRHTFQSGKEYSTELQHDFDTLFNLREQMLKWDLRSELNNNRYTHQVYLANNENSITLKTQNNASVDLNLLDISIKVPSINLPVLKINRAAQYYNLLEMLSIKPKLTKDLQDFNLSASLDYDKNKDVHLVNIPFIEGFPFYFNMLKVSTINVLRSVKEILPTAENINRFVKNFERMVNNVAQEFNEIVQNMNFEKRIKYAQKELFHSMKNYDLNSLSVDGMISWIEASSELHLSGLVEIVERVRAVIIDFIRTYSIDDFIFGILDDMIERMKRFNQQYGILSGMNEAIEKLKIFIKQYDGELVKKYMINEAGKITNLMYESLDRLQTFIREEDLKVVITNVISFIKDIDINKVIQYLKDIIHERAMELLLAEYLKYSKFNSIILPCTVFIDDLLNMLKRTNYQQFVDNINDVVNFTIMYLQDFDYDQFVKEMNALIKEKTDIINQYLQNNDIPMMLKDKVKEVGEKLKGLTDISFADIEKCFTRMAVRLLRATHLDYLLMAIMEAVIAALDELRGFASKYNLQGIVDEIRNFLEKGFTTPKVHIFSYTIPSFEISLGALRKLKIPTEFDTPAFTVPFTDLHLRSFHLDLKTLSNIDIPNNFYTPEFYVLGYFKVDAIKIDFQEIKQVILNVIDLLYSIRRPTDVIVEMLPAVEFYFSDIKPFNIPILTWKIENIDFPDIKFPEFTVPLLNDFDFPKLKIPNIDLPKIPNTVTLPAVGQLNAELKVVTPLYNLQVSAGVHNKTANPDSPVILSFLNAEAKSDNDMLAFQMIADLQVSSPQMQYLEIETNAKLTQALGSFFHKGSIKLTTARVVAHAINTIAANTTAYKAELRNSALLRIQRSISLNSNTSYRHNLTFSSLDGNMNYDNKIMASAHASGIHLDIFNNATMKGHVNEKSYEGKHTNHLHSSILGATFLVKAKVNDVNKVRSINHEMKLKIVPYSMDFRHNGETSINVLGRSIVNTTVKVKLFTLEVNMNHTAEGMKTVKGRINEALHLRATPSEIDLTGYSHCDGKLYLPFQLPTKINFHNVYALTLNSKLQRANWDMSSTFNRYHFGHNFSFSNDADKILGSFSAQGTFNLGFLQRKIDIPAMSIPYIESMTPKVENLVIWDKLNLESLIKTPQQIVNLTMKIQYDKNKHWHAYDILLPEILQNSIDIYRENVVKLLNTARSKSLRWMKWSYDSVRYSYDDLSSDATVVDNVPRLMLPTFTIPILNLQASSYNLDFPDVGFLVSRQYKTPHFNFPIIGYKVPSYKLVLPTIVMPDFNLPKWRRLLILPHFNILDLPQTLYLPAFGNFTYDASFSSTPISVTVNSAIINGSNIIAHVQMHSIGPDFLNMQLNGRSSLSQKANRIKLANTFSFEHYLGNMRHDSSIKMKKQGIDISLDSHGMFETQAVKFVVDQDVHSNSRMKPLLQMKHQASLKVDRILMFFDNNLLPDFNGYLGHNITVDALWPTFSVDSHFKSVGQMDKDIDGSFSGKLENTANMQLNKHGLRSSIYNDLSSNCSFLEVIYLNISSKEEFDLELSALRLYAMLKHNSQNKERVNGKFYGSGQNNMEGKLEFKSTPQELSASLKAFIQQPNSLTQKVHFHEIISLFLNPQNQSIKWNGNGQISSVSYLHEARIANKERKLTYSSDAFLEGHAAFMKKIIFPLYRKSLWDVLKMSTTTREQDLQRIKLSSALEYLKNPNGFLLQPPQLEATNGRKISFPAVTLYIPECVKHLPEKIRQGLFEFPEYFTVPEFTIPFTNVLVPSYTVKFSEIEFPTRFKTTEFRIPFSDLIVPSYTIDLKNIHIPNVIMFPSFSTDFLNFPEIHFPQLEITMNYIAMKEYAVPYFKLSIPAFRINIRRFDWSFSNILYFDILRGYDLEKPIFSFPAIDIDVPAFKLALPAAIKLPSFGSLSGSFNISSPVYNLTLSSSMENGTFANKEAHVIFITDASTMSTLRFLEFDLDVNSLPSTIIKLCIFIALISHQKLTAVLLSFSGTCSVILNVESPSFTNLNVRMDQDNLKVEMSVSTPATGLIGFLVEKATPTKIEIYTKDKIVLIDAEVSLDDPEAIIVLSSWQIGTMDDAVAATRVYTPKVLNNLYQVTNKYHKEHFDMELQEVANRLRENILVFFDILQANWANIKEDVYQWLKGVGNLLEEKLENLKQKLPAMINRIQSNMHIIMKKLTNQIKESILEIIDIIKENVSYLREETKEFTGRFLEWSREMNREPLMNQLYNLTEKQVTMAYKHLKNNAGRLQRETIKAIDQEQLSLPFTEYTIKGKDALILLALWEEKVYDTVLKWNAEEYFAAIEEFVKSTFNKISRCLRAALDFDYTPKLQELMQNLHESELFFLAEDIATAFESSCIAMMDTISNFLQQFKEEYMHISEMLRDFCKEHFENTALSWTIKYWEVENQIVQLIRMILPYREEMGLKYYKEIISIVSNMKSELSDIIKEDDAEKLAAKISEIRNKIKQNVFQLTNTAQVKLQEMYSTADEASSTAHRRIQMTYDMFVDSFDQLLEEGKTISKTSRKKYNIFARKFKEFLQDLYFSIVDTVERITQHEPGRFAMRIPYSFTLDSFNELPQFGSELLQELIENVKYEQKYLKKQLKKMHVHISKNVEYTQDIMEGVWYIMPHLLAYCCKNLNETLHDVMLQVQSNVAGVPSEYCNFVKDQHLFITDGFVWRGAEEEQKRGKQELRGK
uniref:Vitellinogen open beta-sheet domain-containing protein n=1 Tax=Eptatretus burgeri TaxID=7764 RepID=A0A8C4WV89_EPTBU